MSQEVLAYHSRRFRHATRQDWVAAALEVEGSLLLMPALAAGGLSFMAFVASADAGWLVWMLLAMLFGGFGLGLLFAALGLRGRERWAPAVAAALIAVTLLLPAGQAMLVLLQGATAGSLFQGFGVLLCDATLASVQAALLAGLLHHHWRNREDLRRRTG